jgi:uncharacterized membrane protein (DUF4010 family)
VFKDLLLMVPPDALNIALVLALAFFIGLEREEHKQREPVYAFGGVRSFPLIGLVSYALALLSSPQLLPWTTGFVLIGGFMILSYQHKLAGARPAGLTTEISALATYVIGGLVQRQYYWIATAIGVLSVLLLELKKALEGLTHRIDSTEMVTAAKFLVLSVVILPVVPDQEFTQFHLNPFKTWLVVVTVSGISFGSYAVQRVRKDPGTVMISALLGGVYSSTMTTVILAKQAKEATEERRSNLFAGSILAASGVMYARLVLLIALFNRALAAHLAPAFGALAIAGSLSGWLVSRMDDGTEGGLGRWPESKNPLELGVACLFAVLFVAILVLTQLARANLGQSGLYALAALLGLTDVDPFVLSVAQNDLATPIRMAGAAIAIAAASNNVIKALYAYGFADRGTGRKSLALLLILAAFGLAPLAWV